MIFCVLLKGGRSETVIFWKCSPETTLFSLESYLERRYPRHIVRAFLSVAYETATEASEVAANEQEDEVLPQPEENVRIEEAMASFALRWGGLDDAIMLRVLHEGKGRDRLVAIFAIGFGTLPEARDILAPFLIHEEQLIRCATAIVLGFKRDERALPVLEEYIAHKPPMDEQGLPLPGAVSWYQFYRGHIARLLAVWGPSSITPALLKAFQLSWEWEQDMLGFDTQDAFLYALGRRGAIGVLTGMEMPKNRQRLAMAFLALGNIQADERVPGLVLPPTIRAELASALSLLFALSTKEALRYARSYGRYYFRRLESDAIDWSEENEFSFFEWDKGWDEMLET